MVINRRKVSIDKDTSPTTKRGKAIRKGSIKGVSKTKVEDASIYGGDTEGAIIGGGASIADMTSPSPSPLSSTNKGPIPYEAIVEALNKSNGLITIAAKYLNINYRTLAKYIQKNKKLQEALFVIEENIKDKVQSKLYDKIEKGDSGAMYFYLKCKAKDRGFIESPNHMVPPQVPITFNYKLVMPNYPDAKDCKTLDITEDLKQIEHKGTHITKD